VPAAEGQALSILTFFPRSYAKCHRKTVGVVRFLGGWFSVGGATPTGMQFALKMKLHDFPNGLKVHAEHFNMTSIVDVEIKRLHEMENSTSKVKAP